jgi:glycerate kinase
MSEPPRSPKALLAPDSFKGTMSAREVAEALAAGFEAAGWEVDRCPLADGGEGTADALVATRGGAFVEAPAHDPLGRPITAAFALVDGLGAVVEVAAASGLTLLDEAERDPELTTTAGTGELLLAASRRAELILIGVGGSATNDGGAGAIEAIEAGGGLGDARLICLCDARTPWERAPAVFAPQKGAGPDGVARLERRLDELAATLPRDPRGVPLTGAAGGLSGGMWARFGAELASGAAYVCDLVELDRRARDADLVVTGEGRLDETTLEGKVVAEVARRGSAAGTPVHAVVGADASTAELRAEIGLASTRAASTPDELAARARELAEAR